MLHLKRMSRLEGVLNRSQLYCNSRDIQRHVCLVMQNSAVCLSACFSSGNHGHTYESMSGRIYAWLPASLDRVVAADDQ
jgi:hypothetical protein